MSFWFSRPQACLCATGQKTKFDDVLSKLWNDAHDAGRCRYRLSRKLSFKLIEDNPMRPVLLALPERFNLRRSPVPVFSLDDPVSGFNFNRIPKEEIILSMFSDDDTHEQGVESLIAINASPFAPLHCLFIPQPSKFLNQRLRRFAVKAAIECILLSGDRLLCMGFNSLLALASVNHLHFHIWQSPEPIFAMTADTVWRPSLPPFSQLSSHPVHNFVVELTNLDHLNSFIDSVWRIADACHSEQIAYNVFFCRSVNGLVRVVFWPRRSVFGAKSLESGVQIAVAELAGMFVVRDAHNGAVATWRELNDALCAERLPENDFHRLEQRLLMQQ